uniref:Uncharacterized protein n=1 Tax=Sphaerodactylus townsendi TaxID=933632 RepID=A0ACB8EH96_9SAUR
MILKEELRAGVWGGNMSKMYHLHSMEVVQVSQHHMNRKVHQSCQSTYMLLFSSPPHCHVESPILHHAPECCRKSSKSKRDKEKQACKSCSESFNSITKRRHHCKQCGAVICAKCSEFKPFADNSRHNRVCKECFQLLSATCNLGNEAAGEQKKKAITEKLSSLGAENSLFSSQFLFQEKGKAWSKVWLTILKSEPLVLYLEGRNQDGPISRSIPLPGYEVDFPPSGEKFESKYVFKLCHSQQTMHFSAEDEEQQMKWMNILTKASKGETSDPSERPNNP